MNNENSDCLILLLPAEVVAKICRYLRPNDVCQLDETCVRIQDRMNQDSIWKRQVESFPVAGIPFGDSTKPTWRKCRHREDYFNKRFLHLLTEWPIEGGWPDFHEWGDGANAYRIALKTKFTLDKMLGEVKDYFANEFKEDVNRWKEEANRNPDMAQHRYTLKAFQVQVDPVIHKEDTLNMCEWYVKKWMYFGKLFSDRRIDFKPNGGMVSRSGNLFKIEPIILYANLIEIENDSSESSDTENENDSNDDDESDAGEDEEEEVDDSDNDDEEEDMEGLSDNDNNAGEDV